MIKIYCIKNIENRIIDISGIVKEGSSLNKSKNEFAWVYDFAIVKNKDFKGIQNGDIIVIKLDGNEIFSGVVIQASDSELKYRVVDYAWYFNKNEEIYQFEDVEANIVVQKLIETFGGTVGNIDSTNVMVDQFYFGKTLGAIIKEIINNIRDLENKDFRFFYKDTKFHFVLSKKDKFKNKNYTPLKSIKCILNGYEYNALDYIERPHSTKSIDKMMNSYRVYKTSGKEYIQQSVAKDEKNIKKYGLMQKLVEFKDNDLKAGAVTAESLLSQNNKEIEKLSIKIPTLSEFVRDGELLELHYKDYGIDGVYEISSITYNFFNHDTIFNASMDLEKIQ